MNRRQILKFGCGSLLAAAAASAPLRRGLSASARTGANAQPAYRSSPMPPAAEPVSGASEGGALTAAQRDALREASLRWAGETPEAAQALALKLDFVEGESDSPADMDGPLALRILLDAGLMAPRLEERLGRPKPNALRSLWRANPEDPQQRKTFEAIFPHATHELILMGTPAVKINYALYPLYAGDFVISREPSGPNRMFLVTEVDAAGRAYTVTSLARRPKTGADPEYVVKRVMLYDPRRPGEGQIAAWADPRQSPYDYTGAGGLIVYRFRAPEGCDPVLRPCSDLQAALDAQLLRAGGVWHVLAREMGGKDLYRRGSDIDLLHPASMIKLPIAMLVMKYLEDSGTPDKWLDKEADESFDANWQVLHHMLVLSNEESASQLTRLLNRTLKPAGIRAALDAWGAYSTEVEPRRTTMGNMVGLMEGLWARRWLNEAHTKFLLGLLAEVTEGDNSRIWALARALPAGSFTIWNKRGSLAEGSPDGRGLAIAADMGIARITSGGKARDYLIFVHGTPERGLPPFPYQQTYEEIDAAASELIVSLAKKAGWGK